MLFGFWGSVCKSGIQTSSDKTFESWSEDVAGIDTEHARFEKLLFEYWAGYLSLPLYWSFDCEWKFWYQILTVVHRLAAGA